jgi:serine/threonine protein kinase
MTPPHTPVESKHLSSNSGASIMSTSDSLSVPVLPGAGRVIKNEQMCGSDTLIEFPYWDMDYEIVTVGAKGAKKLLGSGVFSDVYHAIPVFAIQSSTQSECSPLHSRSSSTSTSNLPSLPSAYAIKTPSTAAAHKVLAEEARILSFLTRFPNAEHHVVPFYGQDTRSGALVLKLMFGTLEDWTKQTLNSLPEPERATKLVLVFPSLVTQLLDSLTWLKSHGTVHADIKPANILVSSSSTSTPIPHAVFTDFSSGLLTNVAPSSTTPSAPIGGGTWDYLEPHFLYVATRNATPNSSADLWATALSLLTIVLGASPYDVFGSNMMQKRECIKQGNPIGALAYGDDAGKKMQRLKGLSSSLGFDAGKWFKRVLVKDQDVRAGVEEWKNEFAWGCVGSGGEKL